MNIYNWLLRLLTNWKGLSQPTKVLQIKHAHPFTHEQWTALLQQHVNESGEVNYQGFKDDWGLLKTYLNQLSENPPNDEFWTREEKMAYWINAYNAFTIELILQYYPLKSIKDIGGAFPMLNSSWDIPFFNIGKVNFDLNTIEHQILRKEFDEPRVHFALVCASISCPRLLNEAYEAEKLEEQLELQARFFINNPEKNQISENIAQLSSIFQWYESDFTKHISLVEYINQYAEVKIKQQKKVFLEYNWNLNENGK